MSVNVNPPAISSPCIKVCIVDPQAGLCLGCGRSIAEIAGWIGYSDQDRARIMAGLPQRLATLRARNANSSEQG